MNAWITPPKSSTARLIRGDALAHERFHLVGPEPLTQAGRPDDVGEQGRDGPHLVLRSGFLAHRHLLAPQPSPPTRG